MPDALRRTLRLVGALMRASLLTGLQYRSDFLLEGLTGLSRPLAAIAPLWLVYGHREQLAGWSLHDTTLVLALFLLLQALVEGIVEPNLGAVVESVRTGSFDLVLLRPADAQLLVSLQRVAPAQIWQLLAAVALGTWALASRPIAPLDALVAALLLLCGALSMYGLWLLAVCASFIWVRVDNLRHLLGSVSDAGRFLTVVVPVALFTSFPALAIRGAWDAPLVATSLLTTTAFTLGSRATWTACLARYTSASS